MQREWNAWTIISQESMRHNPITDSTQTDTPCHPGELWSHDPTLGMSPKNRLVKVLSISDSFLTVSQAVLLNTFVPVLENIKQMINVTTNLIITLRLIWP